MLQKFDERNRDILININGEMIHRDKAGISPYDSLVQGGDGVWEGLRVYDGRVFKLNEHLDRLRRSAKALDFKVIPSRDELVDQIKKTLAANSMTDNVHIRLTLSRGVKITSGMDPRLNQAGPTLSVLAEHKAPVYADSVGDTGLTLMTSSIRRFPPDCLDPNIHHNNLLQSILAKIEANYAGADDALMLDQRGFLAETNATNVFVITDGVVETSRPIACPEGITRDTVLGLCCENDIPWQERDISLTHVYNADEVFTTGTMGELAWVGTVDGRTIGSGSAGPMTLRLKELFTSLTQSEGVPVVD